MPCFCPDCKDCSFDETGRQFPKCEKFYEEGKDAGLQIAKELTCPWCGGWAVHNLSGEKYREDEYNTVPFRIDEDKYIPNYGRVHEGEWLHKTDWGYGTCAASRICEGTRCRGKSSGIT